MRRDPDDLIMEAGKKMKTEVQVLVARADHGKGIMSACPAMIPADDFLDGIERLVGGFLGCVLITIGETEYECWHDLDACLKDGAVPAALAREFPEAPPLVLFAPFVFAKRTPEGAPLPIENGEIRMIGKWLAEGQRELAEFIGQSGLYRRAFGVTRK